MLTSSHFIETYLTLRAAIVCRNVSALFRHIKGERTQQQFAEEAGISRSKAAHILSGKPNRMGGASVIDTISLIHRLGAPVAILDLTQQQSGRCGILAVAHCETDSAITIEFLARIEAALLVECHRHMGESCSLLSSVAKSAHRGVVAAITREIQQRDVSNFVIDEISKYLFSVDIDDHGHDCFVQLKSEWAGLRRLTSDSSLSITWRS